ncbi:MAG: YkvA family protein, partial [Chloroflexota bacterium]
MADTHNQDSNVHDGLPERARDPGFWKEIWQQIRLVFSLMRDPEVPAYLKLLPLAAILYVLFPLDFAPDFYPVLGQLDDLTALLVGAKVFIEMAPPHVVARHLDKMQAVYEEIDEEDDLKNSIIVEA